MKLNDVKSKYTSAGDIIYRTAFQFVLAKGTDEAKQSRPKKLDTIDSYILACAADIADAEDFVDSMARPETQFVWVVIHKDDDDTDGPLDGSVYATREGAVAEIRRQKNKLIDMYGLEGIRFITDDDEIFEVESIDRLMHMHVTVTVTKHPIR